MNIRNFVMMTALSLTSLSVWSSNGVGNGGNAVVCYTSPARTTISSIEMFDYWEMNQVLPTAGGLNLGGSSLGVRQKIELAISRLRNFDPELAEGIEKYALPMESHIASYLVTAYQLPEIDDANPRALPTGNCFVEQYAVQWSEPVSGQRRFAIAAKFYNVADNDAKAGIILHEAIYKWAIKNGHKDSDGTRYMNFVISTALLNSSTTYATYARYLKEAKFIDKECKLKSIPSVGSFIGKETEEGYDLCASKELSFPKMKITPFRKSELRFNEHSQHWVLSISEQSILSRPSRTGTWPKTRLYRGGHFTFSPNGYVESAGRIIEMEGPTKLDIYMEYKGQKVNCNLYNSLLNANGDITTSYLFEDDNAELIYNSQLLQLSAGFFSLDANGDVKRFGLETPGSFKIPGLAANVTLYGEITLNPAGEITRGRLPTPIVKTIYGTPVTIYVLEFNEVGKIKIDSTNDFRFTTFNHIGHRLINRNNHNTTEYLRTTCQQIDPNFRDGFVLKTVPEFIAAPEEFFDTSSNTLVMKVDEEVKVVTEINCSGNFYVDL